MFVICSTHALAPAATRFCVPGRTGISYFHHYLGNRLISLLFNLLYIQTLSDIEVCHKMFTEEVVRDLRLTSDGFVIEIEITAQIARAAVADLRGGDQ
jgi:hypothetical protein